LGHTRARVGAICPGGASCPADGCGGVCLWGGGGEIRSGNF